MVVFARINDTPGAKGIGAVYVPHDTPGVSFGPAERLLGFRGVPSADVFLDEVSVPRDHVVAQPPAGFRDLMAVFCVERLGEGPTRLGRPQPGNCRLTVWWPASPCVPVRPRASRERDHVTRSGAGRARRRCRGRVVPSRSARDWLTAVCLSTSARRGVRVRAVVPQDVVVYTQERRQFGRPLVEFQAVQLKLAEMKTKVQGRRGGPAHAAGGACSQHARATPSTRLGAPPSPLPPGGCGAAAPGAGRQRGRRVG